MSRSTTEGSKPKKRAFKPMGDPDNVLGRAYADSLRLLSKAVLSGLILNRHAREAISEDLIALAYIAEHHPDAFAGVPCKTK